MAVAMDVPLCNSSYSDKKQYHQILAKRLQKHPMGWLSNLWHVHPKTLNEGDDHSTEYIYGFDIGLRRAWRMEANPLKGYISTKETCTG